MSRPKGEPKGTQIWHYLIERELAITIAFHKRDQAEEEPKKNNHLWGNVACVAGRATLPSTSLPHLVSRLRVEPPKEGWGGNTQGQAYQVWGLTQL